MSAPTQAFSFKESLGESAVIALYGCICCALYPNSMPGQASSARMAVGVGREGIGWMSFLSAFMTAV